MSSNFEAMLRAIRDGVILVGLATLMLAASACDGSGTSPSPIDVTGNWTGTGSYPNAPFQLTLTQSGSSLQGSYSDRLDASLAVTGTVTGSAMTLSVNFGDAQVHLEGTVATARRITGTMRTSALGNTPYPFIMTR